MCYCHKYEHMNVDRCRLYISDVLYNTVDHVLPLLMFMVSIKQRCHNSKLMHVLNPVDVNVSCSDVKWLVQCIM